MFLPGPRDGSLYLFGRDPEALKRLPYTIPQLVANSPCRSSDGILYTGRKVDTWFSIDPTTGKREQLLSFNNGKNTCPLEAQNTIFVGRTEYNIIMVDSKHKDRKWNVTFYDYSAAEMESDMIDTYGMLYGQWYIFKFLQENTIYIECIYTECLKKNRFPLGKLNQIVLYHFGIFVIIT